MPSGQITHPRLGIVNICIRPNSHHVSARWKGGEVSLNIPEGMGTTALLRILDELAPRLLANRPQLHYHDGQVIHCPMVDFAIRTQSFAPSRIVGTPSLPVAAVEVGIDRPLELDVTVQAVSDMLCKLARHIAPQLLVPRARELATRIGRYPVGWTISTGHRTLGRCTAHGIISLSYVLLFLPQHLCDYVICHELAHLTEMNHSPQFHRLLDSYLGGQEAALRRELHAYTWPVLRK